MNWVIRLYALLLRLYPSEFHAEFAEEMTAVFVEALVDAQKLGWLSRLLWYGRELAGLLTILVRERWRCWRGEAAVMNPVVATNHRQDVDDGKVETPLAIIAGILPFILYGLMFTLLGVNYNKSLAWMIHSMDIYLVIQVLLLVGLGIGWAKRFPRWSYAYLGAVVMTSIWLAGVVTAGYRLVGYTFGRESWGWRAWIPMLMLAAVMLLLTRSPQPLARLLQSIRQDWTRLSFALYAALAWLTLGITYDGKSWYNETAYLPLNMFLLTLVITSGALLYMWVRRPWPRVLALQAALIIFLLVSALVAALDGHTEFGSPPTLVGQITYYLWLLIWVSVPLGPGLAQGAWRRLRPT